MNIWTTVEVDSWSRGFDYTGYINLHTGRQEVGEKLSRQAYASLCRMLNAEMERTW